MVKLAHRVCEHLLGLYIPHTHTHTHTLSLLVLILKQCDYQINDKPFCTSTAFCLYEHCGISSPKRIRAHADIYTCVSAVK